MLVRAASTQPKKVLNLLPRRALHVRLVPSARCHLVTECIHRFFILISEMRCPQDAMKAAWALQTFATGFYVLFSVVVYVYIGSTVSTLGPQSLRRRPFRCHLRGPRQRSASDWATSSWRGRSTHIRPQNSSSSVCSAGDSTCTSIRYSGGRCGSYSWPASSWLHSSSASRCRYFRASQHCVRL